MANRANMTPDERFIDRTEESVNAWQAIAEIFTRAEAWQERFCNEVLGMTLADVRATYTTVQAQDELNRRYKAWFAAQEESN